MYDPTVGKWITEDPIGFEGGDANLYRYVRNAALVATDPSGLVTVTLNIHYFFTKLDVNRNVKMEFNRILGNCLNHCADPKDRIKLTWIREPNKVAFDAVDYGVHGTTVDLGIRDTLNMGQNPGQGGAGAGRANLNANVVIESARSAQKPVDYGVAASIAHELLLHALGGKFGHFHSTSYVDANNGRQIGANLSREACELIIEELGLSVI